MLTSSAARLAEWSLSLSLLRSALRNHKGSQAGPRRNAPGVAVQVTALL